MRKFLFILPLIFSCAFAHAADYRAALVADMNTGRVLISENANMICSSNIKDNPEYEIATKIAVYLDSNDIVTTIESAEIIASENIDILNDFESYYNSNYEKIGNYGGYTYDIHQEKKRLLANVIIDYNTFNTEAYVADYPEIAETFNEEYKMTKDKTTCDVT